MPTISVVIPCYNAAPFLRETLDSALNQTHPPLEILVIDDGSTDDSAAIADSYGPPVRVLRQPNQGESVARNHGIRETSGDYLLFLDADDQLEGTSLERLLAAIADRPGTVGVMGLGMFGDDPMELFGVTIPQMSSFFPTIIRTTFGAPHTTLLPTAVVRDAGGFPEEHRYSEDWIFLAKVALTGAPLVSIPHVGAFYRRHPSSQLATAPRAGTLLGHVAVMQTLAEGILCRPELLNKYGESVFWSGVTALTHARHHGISWQQLTGLSTQLEKLAICGPTNMRRSHFVRLVQFIGYRWADAARRYLRRLNGRRPISNARIGSQGTAGSCSEHKHNS